MNKLSSNATYYALSVGINAAAQLAIALYLISAIGVREYGILAVTEALLALLLVIAGCGLNVSIVAEIANQQTDPRRTRQTAVALAGVLGVLTALAVGLLAWPLAGLVQHDIPSIVVVLVGAICVTENTSNACLNLLRADGLARRYFTLSVIQACIYVALTFAIVSFHSAGFEAALYARLIATGLVASFAIMWRDLGTIHVSTARRLLAIGLPLVPATVSSTWLMYAPRFILSWFFASDVVGIYAFTVRLASVLALVIVQPLSLLWHPLMFRLARHRNSTILFGRAVDLYAIGAWLPVGAALSGSLVWDALASQYSVPFAMTAFALTAIALWVQGLTIVLNVGPYIVQRTQEVLPAYVVAVAVATVLLVILCPSLGVTGAAAAHCVGACTLAVQLRKVSNKLVPTPLNTRTLIKVLGVAAISVTGAIGISSIFIGYRLPVAAFVALSVFGGSYVFGLFLARALKSPFLPKLV